MLERRIDIRQRRVVLLRGDRLLVDAHRMREFDRHWSSPDAWGLPWSSSPPSPIITPPDGSAATAAVPIRGSDPPLPSPRAGIVTGHRRPGGPSPCPGEREAGPVCKSLPEPSARSGRPNIEGSNMSKSPSGRKRATRASSPTGENEILPTPAARGPESLLRGNSRPRLEGPGSTSLFPLG